MTPLRLAFATMLAGGAILVAALAAAPLAAVLCAMLAAGAMAVLMSRSEPAEPPPSPPPPAPVPQADVIEALDDPILVVERRIVMRANAAARALLGAHIVGDDARVAIRHPAAASRLGGPAEHVRRVPLSGLGGRESRWEMAITPGGEGSGEDARVVHLVDRSTAHAAETMRVDFVANASHELRTPLATLLGFIETLADPDGPDDAATRARFLGIMLGEARRMRQLVDDLISLSRIEADRHKPADTPLALAPLVAQVADTMRVAAGEPPGTFLLALGDDEALVAGDEAQLSQLLHNILGNALKYRRPGTPVRVALASLDGFFQLAVADEGEGIAAEHLPRLTERFYRVDTGRSRSLGGTGLGLAIVKHIVERHRGRLDIASRAGIGTTVSVLLPAAGTESQKRHPAVIKAPPDPA